MFKQSEDVRIHYETCGDHGSRVLLLHGWGCDISLMRPIANALQTDHRVLIIDFPGHGESGRPPEPWGIPEYGKCLIHFLEDLDFIPCSVIAHSFGCRVATWIASENPDLFQKMIFTGAAGIRPKQREESRKRSERYKTLRNRAELIGKIPFLRGAAHAMEDKLRRKYGSADYNRLDEEMRATFVKVVNFDLSDRYERIHQSTLLIWGDQDKETPLWMGREMEKRIPDSALILLEGGTHFAYLEQNDRFNLIAKQFLKED